MPRRERQLRILTFGTHESFNFDICKTGHRFDFLFHPDELGNGASWDLTWRPVPPNARLIGPSAHLDLPAFASRYDLILCQTLQQFFLVEDVAIPKVLYFHTWLTVPPEFPSREIFLAWAGLPKRLAAASLVFPSHLSMNSWGLSGRVVPPGIDHRDHADVQWTGECAAVFSAVHQFKERDADTGYSRHQAIVGADIPFKIMGRNPSLNNAEQATSWEHLKQQYQRYRVYLHTGPYGPTLAPLEAAACGMPIVCWRHADVDSSRWLFTDGVDALTAHDIEGMRERVLWLLADHDRARQIGERGRLRVMAWFAIERFLSTWHETLSAAAATPVDERPTFELPGADFFRARIEPIDVPDELQAGAVAFVRLRVTNLGGSRWRARTKKQIGAVTLAHTWLGELGAPWYGRAVVHDDVDPGDRVEVVARLVAPALPGSYRLRWELVCEHVCWFAERGGPIVEIPLTVV